MLPSQLTAASFTAYPPEARAVAVRQLPLLRKLPLAFLPLLLRELIVYDWKFPAERADLDRQFSYLAQQPGAGLAPFEQLKLTRELDRTDWVNAPAAFSEQLSAHLWATHQIDAFRTAATEYVAKSAASAPEPEPATHRLGIAVIGAGATANDYRLFRKLERHGVHYTKVTAEDGLKPLLGTLTARAETHPVPYGHWFIDGHHDAAPSLPKGMAQISWQALAAPRAAIQTRMQKTYSAPIFDPEAFRSMLARLQPADVGLANSDDALLNRYRLSVLTEGSGTQVFATTFVQWATREALRRAQPITLLARFGPRQREKQMNELLAEQERAPELDPQGSLIDADMAAYYHWLNQQRLSGDKKSAFLAWFEGHEEAVVVAPGFEKSTRNSNSVDLADLAARIS